METPKTGVFVFTRNAVRRPKIRPQNAILKWSSTQYARGERGFTLITKCLDTVYNSYIRSIKFYPLQLFLVFIVSDEQVLELNFFVKLSFVVSYVQCSLVNDRQCCALPGVLIISSDIVGKRYEKWREIRSSNLTFWREMKINKLALLWLYF